MTGKIADMFARFETGISIFMEKVTMPRRSSGGALQVNCEPDVFFASFNEVSLALRRLDVHRIHLVFFASDHVREPSPEDRDRDSDLLEDRLAIWS